MAETNKATVTPTATAGDSPTATAPVNAPIPNPAVAESFDDFLDRQGESLAAKAQSKSGEPKPEEPTDPAEAEEPDAEKAAEPEAKEEVDTSKEESEETKEQAATDEEAAEPEGKFEKGVLAKLKEAKIPESLQKRIAKAFEKEIKNREALAERDEILVSKDSEIEALKTRLSEASDKATIIPSGPLAHLDSLEKLQEAVDAATHNLQWAETRNDFERYFKDDDGADEGNGQTAEQKFQEFKAQQLWVLKNQPTQAKVLIKRQELRESLKKSKPDLFRAESEDAKAFSEFFKNDPRTREDADQLAADAIRGRRIREEEATGDFKYHRIDLKAAKANGAIGATKHTANGSTNGSEVNGSRQVSLPSARPVTRVPTKPQSKPKLQQLAEQASNGGHSLDDYLDAQLEATSK